MATTQEILDRLAAANAKADVMQTGITDIQGDVTALLALAQSGAGSDEILAAATALDTKLSGLGDQVAAIDAQYPPPPTA